MKTQAHIDMNKEWDFLTDEVHREKPSRRNVLKREILFGLQILLGALNMREYLALKRFYINGHIVWEK